MPCTMTCIDQTSRLYVGLVQEPAGEDMLIEGQKGRCVGSATQCHMCTVFQLAKMDLRLANS